MNGPHNAIGWCDYTWNPVTGCKHNCRFGSTGVRCYAESIARRFAGGPAFPRGFEPTFHPERLEEPLKVKTSARIFAVSMGDLFGAWVPDEWIAAVLEAIRAAPWHTFILLTKAPWNAIRWPMPDTVWLGATVTGGLANERRRLEAVAAFQAPVRWLSCEPLEGPVDPSIARPDWLVIGAATGAGAFQPDEAWIRGLEDYADAHALPIYHKSNLRVRQQPRHEWPDGLICTTRRTTRQPEGDGLF